MQNEFKAFLESVVSECVHDKCDSEIYNVDNIIANVVKNYSDGLRTDVEDFLWESIGTILNDDYDIRLY